MLDVSDLELVNDALWPRRGGAEEGFGCGKVLRCSGLLYIGRVAGRQAALGRQYSASECSSRPSSFDFQKSQRHASASSWPSNFLFPEEQASGGTAVRPRNGGGGCLLQGGRTCYSWALDGLQGRLGPDGCWAGAAMRRGRDGWAAFAD
jgi:hypothetical protein